MFDPYHKWLGIPKKYRPPTYYQLLGLEPEEVDPEVIEEAAIRQSAHLRTYQTGPQAELCTRLLNEISVARTTLLDPNKRKKYDAELAKKAPKKPTSPAAPSLPPENDPSLAFADLKDSPTLVETPKIGRSGRASDRVQRIRKQPDKVGLFGDDKTKYIIFGVGGGVALLLAIVIGVVIAVNSSSTEPDDPVAMVQNPPPAMKPPVQQPLGNKPPGQQPPGNKPPGQQPPGNKPPGQQPPGNKPPNKDVPNQIEPVVRPNPNGQGPTEIDSFKLKRPGPAGAFCILPNGREVIVAGFRLEKYHRETHRLLKVYEGAKRGSSPYHNFLQLSPDGKTLYSVQMGARTVYKWDVESGRLLGRFGGHGTIIEGMALLPNGRHLISLDRQRWRLWDVNTFEEVFRSPEAGEVGTKSTMALSPDGAKLLLYRRNRAELWDVPTKQIVKDFFSSGVVWSATMAANGSIATGYRWIQNRETVRLARADFRQGSIVNTDSRGHSVNFSPDGKYVVAGTDDGSIHLCLFDLNNPRVLYKFQAHDKAVLRVRFSDDGKHIYSCGSDGTFKTWQVPGDVVVAAKPKPNAPEPGGDRVLFSFKTKHALADFCFVPNTNEIIFGSRTIARYDLGTKELRQIYATSNGGSYMRNRVFLSPDGQRLFAQHMGGPLYMFDVESGRKLGHFKHKRPVFDLLLHPDGKRLITLDQQKWRIWDTDNATVVFESPEATAPYQSMELSPDRKRLFICAGYNMEIWDLATNQRILRKRLRIHGYQFAIAPDESLIIRDSKGINYFLPNFKFSVSVPTDPIYSLALSPNGKRVAAAGRDGFLQVYTVPDLTPVLRLEGHDPAKQVARVPFSDDGKKLYSCSVDGSFKIWKLPEMDAVANKEEPKQPAANQPQGLPTPELKLLSNEPTPKGTKYWLSISNWSEFTDERFAEAGLKPPAKPVIEIRGDNGKTIEKTAFTRTESLKKFYLIISKREPQPDRILAIIGVPRQKTFGTSKLISLSQ